MKYPKETKKSKILNLKNGTSIMTKLRLFSKLNNVYVVGYGSANLECQITGGWEKQVLGGKLAELHSKNLAKIKTKVKIICNMS